MKKITSFLILALFVTSCTSVGKFGAGVDITFNVRAGSAGTNTGAVRINNGGGLPTAVTGFAVASSMVIMEVL